MSSKSQTRTVSNPDKIWTRDFVLVCLANFFIFLGFQLIGFVVGVFTFSALLFRPYAGQSLETKGRRFVYMLGLGIFVFSVGAMGFITGIGLLIIIRIVQGVGWGFSTTATGTIATDLIPPKRRGEGMGYFGLSGNIALAFGPTLGLALVGKISFTSLFLISAALGLAAFLLSSIIRYKKVEKSPDKTTTWIV